MGLRNRMQCATGGTLHGPAAEDRGRSREEPVAVRGLQVNQYHVQLDMLLLQQAPAYEDFSP